ncbi:MAG: TonB-dependent receptor [Spirochaetes bacterium]|nr:TonB-dependent receptor [Spirochaetota bacterium]
MKAQIIFGITIASLLALPAAGQAVKPAVVKTAITTTASNNISNTAASAISNSTASTNTTVSNAAAPAVKNTAAETTAEARDVVVTATRLETPQSQIGASVTVITADTIKKTGARDVSDALRTVSGITAAQSGAFGGIASVFMRGLGSERTLVMINGVAVNSSADFSHSFNFANLPADDVERIEVIRGPQSTLYGSDAMAGVINIITKKGKGAPQATVSLEGGSYATLRGAFDYAGKINDVSLSLGGSHLRSEGISKALVTNGTAAENDPYHLTTVVSRVEYKPFDSMRLFGSLHYTHAKTAIDDNSFKDDPNYYNFDERAAASLGIAQRCNDLWNYSLTAGYVFNRNEAIDSADTNENTSSWYVYLGNTVRADWQNNITIGDLDTVTLGINGVLDTSYSASKAYDMNWNTFLVEYQESIFPIRYQLTAGGYAQNHFSLWGMLNNTTGVRYDYSTNFGGALTWKTSFALTISNIGLTVKGNYGTGFKAPTAYQLYYTSMGGNNNLKPEALWSVDAGLREEIGKYFTCEATYFYTASSNQIAWETTNFMTYAGAFNNIASKISRGAEASFTVSPIDELAFTGSYAYTDSFDTITGKRSDRIPPHKASISAVGTLTNIGFGGLTLTYVSERPDAGATQMLRHYFKLDASVTYTIERWEFNLRGENLLNQQYMEVTGYATPGVSVYGGVKVKL